MLVFVEFQKVPVGIFLWFILFLNGGAVVYALNFSCSFYRYLLIYVFPFYFTNSPGEINSLLSEFFISSHSYGLWPEMRASDEVLEKCWVHMSSRLRQTLETGLVWLDTQCVLCTFLNFPDCCQKVSFNLSPPK